MMIELPPNLPVGVRFHPTDEELITRYLQPKILGRHFDDAIAEIDICNWEPWELPDKSKIKSKSEDRMWWFMCRPSYKNQSSDRLNRTTETGFWKVTGQARTIKDKNCKDCIGKKRTLVFHTGKSPGKRTNWVMQEYYLDPKNMPSQERASYVICRLKKKSDEKVDTPDGEPSGEIIPDLENSEPTSGIQQLHAQTEANGESDELFGAFRLTEDDIRFMLSDELNDELGMVNDESEESPDVFVDGIIRDPDEIYLDEITGTLFRDSSLPESLKRSYFVDAPGGSDTDAEVVSSRYVQTGQNSSLFDPSGNSKRARQMRMVNVLSEPLRTCAMSQDFGQETVVSVSNPLSKEDASSSNLTRPVERSNAISIKIPAEPLNHVEVKGGSRQKRIQLQNNSTLATSSNKGKEALEHVVTTTDQPRKGTMTREFRNVGKVTERSNMEKHNLVSDKCESSSSKWNTIFTLPETSSVSTCNSQPPFVYWFNAITGTVLFCIFLRELVVFGSW